MNGLISRSFPSGVAMSSGNRSVARLLEMGLGLGAGKASTSSETKSVARRRRRRYLRIGLRGLMVLVLVLGGGFGWLARRVNVQRDAVAAVKSGAWRYRDL